MEKPTIVASGITGSGKSSFGNLLNAIALKDQHFDGVPFRVGHGFDSETKECSRKELEKVVYIDTPGLFDTNDEDTKMVVSIAECLRSVDEVNCFVCLVPFGRLTDEMLETVAYYANLFKHLVQKHRFAMVITKIDMIEDHLEKLDIVAENAKVAFSKALEIAEPYPDYPLFFFTNNHIRYINKNESHPVWKTTIQNYNSFLSWSKGPGQVYKHYYVPLPPKLKRTVSSKYRTAHASVQAYMQSVGDRESKHSLLLLEFDRINKSLELAREKYRQLLFSISDLAVDTVGNTYSSYGYGLLQFSRSGILKTGISTDSKYDINSHNCRIGEVEGNPLEFHYSRDFFTFREKEHLPGFAGIRWFLVIREKFQIGEKHHGKLRELEPRLKIGKEELLYQIEKYKRTESEIDKVGVELTASKKSLVLLSEEVDRLRRMLAGIQVEEINLDILAGLYDEDLAKNLVDSTKPVNIPKRDLPIMDNDSSSVVSESEIEENLRIFDDAND